MTSPTTSSRPGTRRTGILLALGTAAISGVAVFLNADAVRAFGDATAYTTAKNLVAALVLLAVVGTGSRTGARLTRPRTRGQWVGLSAIGLVGGSVPFVLFFEGLSRASSAQAAFLHKTLLVWVAVLAVVFLSERLSGLHVLAIALLVVGQIGLIGGVGGFGSPEAMILAATLMWSVEVVVAKRVLAGVSSWTVGVARMALGSAVLLGWVVVRGDLGLLTSMTAEQLGWVLLTGVLLAGYVGTWFAALQRAPAVDVTAVLVLAAPVTAGLNAAADGVPLGPQLDWLVVLLAGGALALWAAGRTRTAPVAAA
jgi:drug/metabolite transporter (DMT)-like permease